MWPERNSGGSDDDHKYDRHRGAARQILDHIEHRDDLDHAREPGAPDHSRDADPDVREQQEHPGTRQHDKRHNLVSQKPGCASTPHAWFTAWDVTRNTPSETHVMTTDPAMPNPRLVLPIASSWLATRST